MNKSNVLKFSEINIGDVHQFERKISKQDISDFANLTNDFNPLHVDEEFGKKSQFNTNIAHGMLVASLFSTLIGMHCPGEKSLYMGQTLNFRLPIFPEDLVIIKGTVIDKNESIRLITLKTEILKQDKVVVNGEAKVRMLGDEK